MAPSSASLQIGLFILIFVSLMQVHCVPRNPGSTETKPEITFAHLGPSWRKLSEEGERHTVYAPKGDDYFTKCRANYPIQWNITGHLPILFGCHLLNEDLIEGWYEIGLYIFFLDGDASPDLASSAIIACEKVDDHRLRVETAVFVRGNNPFVELSKNTVLNSAYIPCATTNPTTPTTLYIINSDGVERQVVEDVEYRPTKGFYSVNEKQFSGVYQCRKENNSVTILAEMTRKKGYHFSPDENSLRRFADESVILQCTSDIHPIKMIYEEVPGVDVRFLSSSGKTQVIELSSKINDLNKTILRGKVGCYHMGIGGQIKEMIKEWSVEFFGK